VSRRDAILAHLSGHPDLTATALARVTGGGASTVRLLRDMEFSAQVISRTVPRGGRPVRFWRVAPPDTVPPPRPALSADALARRRERDRRNTAARCARARGPFAGAALLPDAACIGTDPALFFPEPGDTETEARAVAVCAACTVRAACLARAIANGERHGIFAGVNFETRPAIAGPPGSAP
jgi:hypothetical protein